MAVRQILAEQAEIKLAKLEIRALTINGRQVTQALFRQLIEEPYLDAEFQPRGRAWGYVNHHFPSCERPHRLGPHYHVIWQWGTELRRATVLQKEEKFWDDKVQKLWRRCGELEWLAVYLRGGREMPHTRRDKHIHEVHWASFPPSDREFQVPYRLVAYLQDIHQPTALTHDYQREQKEQRREEVEAAATKLMARLQVTNFDQAVGDLAVQDRLIEEHRACWLRAWEAVKALDQLFIAV